MDTNMDTSTVINMDIITIMDMVMAIQPTNNLVKI